MKQQNLLIWLVVILWFSIAYVSYQWSTDDINTQEVLRQELSWVVESISWLNLQLSGLTKERTELEKQQTELSNKWNEYRKEIEKLKFKKTWLEMSLGLSQASQPQVATETPMEAVNKLITLTGN